MATMMAPIVIRDRHYWHRFYSHWQTVLPQAVYHQHLRFAAECRREKMYTHARYLLGLAREMRQAA